MGRLGKVDPNSYSEPEKIHTIQSLLTWKIDFKNTKILGSVVHKFKILEENLPAILLDVRDITVKDASIIAGPTEIPINHFVSDEVTDIGSKLTLELPQGTAKGEYEQMK